MSNNQLRFAANNRNRTAIDPINNAAGVSFSHADSTAVSKGTSAKLHDVWRVQVEGLRPFIQAEYDEFDGDNLENYMRKYALFLCTTPIPSHRKDGTILPSNPENRKCLTTQTLVGYFGNTHCHIKSRFPHHPDFAPKAGNSNDTDPTWYSALRQEFIQRSTRHQLELTNADDIVFGTTKSLPIYRCNKPPASRGSAIHWDELEPEEHWHISTDTNPSPSDVVCTTDLRQLNKNAILRHDFNVHTRGMMEAMLINTIYHTACRGGEPKFLNWNECHFDPAYHFIVFTMPEAKTLEKGRPTPFVPDPDCPYSCPYHGMCRYLFVGNGLVRTEKEDKAGCVNMVFPSLHNGHSQKSTADAATTAIRNNLPKNTPSDLRLQYSSKSLRQGAITTMACNRRCGIFEVTGRSGHSLNLTIDYYNQKEIFSSMPGAVVLAGYDDPDQVVFMPRWEVLEEPCRKMVDSLITAIHGSIDVPVLKPGQRLYPFICKCACFLVMWHNQITKECGDGNSVSAYVKMAARKCNLSDARYPHLSPEMVLSKWSEIILLDYQRRNNPQQFYEDTFKGVSHNLSNFAESQYNLSCSFDGLSKQVQDALQSFSATLDIIRSTQDNKIAALEAHCRKLQSKVAFIKTPEPSPSNKRLRVLASTTVTETKVDAEVSDSHSVTLLQNSANGSQEVSILPAKDTGTGMSDLMRNRLDFLENVKKNANVTNYGSCVEYLPEKAGNKGIGIEQVMLTMKKQGQLLDLAPGKTADDVVLKDLTIPNCYNEKHHARNCLDLVQYTLRKQNDLNNFRKLFLPYKSMENGEWIKFFSSIANKAFRMMWILEGKDPDEEEKIQRTTKGRKMTTAYVGLGGRVKEYKRKIIAGLPDDQKPKDMVACPILDEIPQSGTPKGNKSIAAFFPKKSKKRALIVDD